MNLHIIRFHNKKNRQHINTQKSETEAGNKPKRSLRIEMNTFMTLTHRWIETVSTEQHHRILVLYSFVCSHEACSTTERFNIRWLNIIHIIEMEYGQLFGIMSNATYVAMGLIRMAVHLAAVAAIIKSLMLILRRRQKRPAATVAHEGKIITLLLLTVISV